MIHLQIMLLFESDKIEKLLSTQKLFKILKKEKNKSGKDN